MPNCYINKVRHTDSKINKLIPPKKRVFISKLINPHELTHGRTNAVFLSIPLLKKCYITNQYIIQNTDKIFRTKKNKCYFTTKIYLKKEEKEEKEEKINNILNIKKMPKVYKKTIMRPDKNTLLRKKSKSKSKSNKHIKHSNVIDITNKKNNIEIYIKKDKKRKERISLVSKDKDKDPYLKNFKNIIEKENERNRNSNLIIKQDSNTIRESSDSNKNNIDISIVFSNEEILKKTRKIKKYPSSAKKNQKNLVASLYKDLREINKKYNNEDLKKNYLNMHYDKHVGDEETCPICLQVRKRGKESEREKGLFSAFSFRNINNFNNNKSISKLKISLQQKFKEREKDTNIWNNFLKKKKLKENNNLNNYLSSMNNDDDDSDFKKKYMQFNGMNRFKRLRRYGSCDDFVYSECFSHINNVNKRNLKLNMKKESEKNYDEMNKLEYPALKNYFHKD